MAETALTSISRIKLKDMAEDGDAWAEATENMLSEPNRYLPAVLVVNSASVVIAACIATVLTLHFMGCTINSTCSWGWSEVIASILTSLVIVIFCEILSKTLAVRHPIRTARMLTGPVRGAAWLLRPLLWVLEGIAAIAVRLTGGKGKLTGPFVIEEESRLKATISEEDGELEEEETEMIHSIFEFADTTVHEIMIPRIDMVTLPSDARVVDAVDVALQGGFSRIPVYEKSVGIDEIIGVLYAKDMLKQLRDGHDNLPIRDLLRPAYYVPETKKLDELLREIKQNRVHMVIVVDEYGSVAGLVTIEDLVEEIVGDIQDEYDREENLYEKVSENEYIVDARMNIDEFSELVNAETGDEEGYDTLGGFVYAELDKIPSAGDTITRNNLTYTVLATRGRRITKVRVQRNVPEKADQELQSNGEEKQEQSDEKTAAHGRSLRNGK